MGHGSGVFAQPGYIYDTNSRPMVDLIFGVDDVRGWHTENIKRNGSHYSWLSWMGSGLVTRVNQWGPAGVYFHPDILLPHHSLRIKYGVVDKKRLCDDLTNWSALYIAGRMHKPVRILQDNDEVASAQHENIINAFRTALLLLPQHFTDDQLWQAITAISYEGDIRMGVAENPNKIANLVRGHGHSFQQLYEPAIKACSSFVSRSAHAFGQDYSHEHRAQQMLSLPIGLRTSMHLVAHDHIKRKRERKEISDRRNDISFWYAQCIRGPVYQRWLVSEGLSYLVRQSSSNQVTKGLLTAGVYKSVQYAIGKIMKMRAAK